MKIRFIKPLFILFILFACAGRLISPPDQSTSSNSEQISTKYLNDYKNLSVIPFNCDYYLKQDYSNFPLKEVMDLYISNNCEILEVSKSPKWLLKRQQEIILSKDVTKLNDENLIKYSDSVIFYTRYLKTQKQKELHLKKELKKFSKNKELNDKLYKHLYKISPRLNPEIDIENYYLIGRDFQRNRKFKTARKYYRYILFNPKESISKRILAWSQTLRTYKNERNKPKYLFTIYKFRAWIKRQIKRKNKYSKDENRTLVRSYQKWTIRLARSLWNQGHIEKAKYLLKVQLKSNDYSTENIALMNWLIANMYLEQKKNDIALKYLSIAEKINHNNISLKDTILWSYSFTLILKNEYKLAATELEKNIPELEKISPRPKLNFWLAFCLKEIGDKRSNEIFDKISTENPFNYYGIISTIILEKPFEKINIRKPVFPTFDLKYAWLYFLKDKEILKEYMSKKIHKEKYTNDQYFSYMYYSKDFNNAIFKYFSLKPEQRKKLKDIATSFLFPIPYKDEIEKASKSFNVKSPLIFSITRQESAFNTHARSPADAFGLMQLIPKRAIEISKKLNIEYNNLYDLYDPQKNINMGTYLLEQTLKQYNGNFVKTVASYNAGPGAIKRWFKSRFKGDYLKFIELIPYRETRKYVKLTFRNYVIYKQILSDKDFMLKKNIFSNINETLGYYQVSEN